MDARDDARAPVAGRRERAAGSVRGRDAAGLAAQGYAGDTITDHVHLLADLSGWLAGRGWTPPDLTAGGGGVPAARRRGRAPDRNGPCRAIAPVLGYLRSVGAAPPRARRSRRRRWRNCWPPTGSTWRASGACRQAPSGITCGMRAGSWPACRRDRWAAPSRGCPPPEVTGYVLERAARQERQAPDMVTLPALRSLLRYLHVSGLTRLPLAGAVPAGRALPEAGPAAGRVGGPLRAVLAACDRESAGGRRDYAIMLVDGPARAARRRGRRARARRHRLAGRPR